MNTATIHKIKQAIAEVLPGNQQFTLMAEETGISGKKVLRVVTPAWKSLDKMERILRVQKAVAAALNPTEFNRIFRFSVLTDNEWKRARLDQPPATTKILARKRAKASAH